MTGKSVLGRHEQLQHFVDKYKRGGGKRLVCCFVNLTKAYDSVPRDLLWQRLHDVGVRGRMLHAIRAQLTGWGRTLWTLQP